MKRVKARAYLLLTVALALVTWGLAQNIGCLNAAAMTLGAAGAAAMMFLCLYWLQFH